MKTTVELSPPLLAKAKSAAAREGTTLRALLEEGLRLALARRGTEQRFRLRDARFKGKGRGLHPEFARRGWSALREAAYGDDVS